MEAYVVDWLSLLGRWVHFITGIAWIGASFYFIWLDNHLEPPAADADEGKGVGGELWSVHGGGFYHAQKYRLAPQRLPETLHWFKWEAYSTWLSGIFLLALVYWYGANVYLIDPLRADISQGVAIGIGVGTLVFGWLIYDLLCKSPLSKNETGLGIAIALFVGVTAWGLCQLFSGRGAYMHFGAMLGTIMVANVAMVIMPGQRAMVEATRDGLDVDPGPGIRAKQRSVHNTYFTLPVLFVMLSNHYAMTYAHSYNWLILIAMSVAGALIRVYFVARHKGNASPAPVIVAVLILLGVAAAITPQPVAPAQSDLIPQSQFADVMSVIEDRCVSCHAQKPTHPAFPAAPGGVMLDSKARVLADAVRIYQQTVVLKAMPLGNLTNISDAERALIAHWYAAGAHGE